MASYIVAQQPSYVVVVFLGLFMWAPGALHAETKSFFRAIAILTILMFFVAQMVGSYVLAFILLLGICVFVNKNNIKKILKPVVHLSIALILVIIL